MYVTGEVNMEGQALSDVSLLLGILKALVQKYLAMYNILLYNTDIYIYKKYTDIYYFNIIFSSLNLG